MISICTPAIIYLIFSITQILIDIFKGLYNTAFIKVIVATTITLLLNILCQRGLGIVSWIIVFIPFIFMTVVVSLILYIFGLDASTGKINNTNNINREISCKYNNNVSYDASGNIIILDPEYNSYTNPVYFKYPNIVVPNPSSNDIITVKKTNYIPNFSSSPAYQS